MLPSTMSSCDFLDLIDVSEKRRAACRISVRKEHLANAIDLIHARRLQFGIVPTERQDIDVYGGSDPTYFHNDDYEIYVAADVMVVQELIQAEYQDDHGNLGYYYDYPICCIKAFAISVKHVMHKYNYLSSALSESIPGEQFSKYMTPDLHNRTISFFPCRFDCQAALKIASRRGALMEAYGKPIAPTIFERRVFDVA